METKGRNVVCLTRLERNFEASGRNNPGSTKSFILSKGRKVPNDSREALLSLCCAIRYSRYLAEHGIK